MTPDPSYKDDLRKAYDADVARRDAMEPATWRIETIDRFSEALTEGAASTVLELGCGTGQLAHYLLDMGFAVSAIDLSPGNVEATKRRGVDAEVADFVSLPYADASFDAAFAFNSLIHVPEAELPEAFAEIRRVLIPGALLLVVVWGGTRHEGPLPDDWLDPPRYFSFYADDEIVAMQIPGFTLVDFTTRDDTEDLDHHAQILFFRAI
jgi:SAM-dependent methyltransferase